MGVETLFIVMPAYNESSNIKNVIEEWYPILENADENSRMVVSDGGSTDDTLDILFQLKKIYSKLEVLPRPNTDHGTKVTLLYKYAIENGADWIFQTDSDGQTKASEFNIFWEKRNEYDCILGNRTKRGDGNFRALIEFVLRIYVWCFFGVIVPDANAPFRLMKANTVKKYVNLFDDNFALPNAVLSACFSKYKEKVQYIPISFQPRQGGSNYINVKRIIHYGIDSIRSFWRVRQNMKELNNAK